MKHANEKRNKTDTGANIKQRNKKYGGHALRSR
jgi:hypothetical protein